MLEAFRSKTVCICVFVDLHVNVCAAIFTVYDMIVGQREKRIVKKPDTIRSTTVTAMNNGDTLSPNNQRCFFFVIVIIIAFVFCFNFLSNRSCERTLALNSKHTCMQCKKNGNGHLLRICVIVTRPAFNKFTSNEISFVPFHFYSSFRYELSLWNAHDQLVIAASK